MKLLLLRLALGASLAAASLAPAAAQTIPSGSYQSSCTNVRVNGDQLIARCTNAQGASVRTSIARNSCRGGDIANVNGQLVCNGGTYGNAYGYGNGNGHAYGRHRRHHDADDRNMNGNNGNMGYGYGNRGSAANGSYLQSCQNVQRNGSMITATCPSANGSMITTSIDARSCNGGDVANRNGRLVCS